MKYGIKALIVSLCLLAVAGCNRVTVPPAHLGKILSPDGYSTEVKQTGKYTIGMREELVLLDTSTQTVSETMRVKMLDRMDLQFEIRFRTRIGGGDKTINSMFNDIKVQDNLVSLQQVYGVYGRDMVQTVARSVVGKYRTEDVGTNFDQINKDLQIKLKEAMANSPLEVSNVTLANLKYPDVITQAIEKQSERELAIKTEENQQAIEMVKRENSLKLAQAQREIDLTVARTLRDQNEITAAGISPNLLAYEALKVQALMAENKNVVFAPYQAFGTPGMSNKVFNGGN
jgi:hypothetical protein